MSIPPPPPPPPYPPIPAIPPPPTVVTVENGGYVDTESKPAFHWTQIVNTITHLLLGGVVACGILIANRLESVIFLFNALKQHILLCVIGYVILMSQAILTFSPVAGWAMFVRYQDKKIVHSTMQVSGSILALTGSILKIVDTPNGQQFQTVHGIMGLIAMLLTFVSLVGGVLNFLFSAQAQQTIYKILHSCIGSLTITIAFLTLCLGFNKDINRNLSGDANANFAIIITILALIGTLFSAVINNFKRFGC